MSSMVTPWTVIPLASLPIPRHAPWALKAFCPCWHPDFYCMSVPQPILWKVTYCFPVLQTTSVLANQWTSLLPSSWATPLLMMLNLFYIWTFLVVLSYPRVPYRVSLYIIVTFLPSLTILYITLHPVYLLCGFYLLIRPILYRVLWASQICSLTSYIIKKKKKNLVIIFSNSSSVPISLSAFPIAHILECFGLLCLDALFCSFLKKYFYFHLCFILGNAYWSVFKLTNSFLGYVKSTEKFIKSILYFHYHLLFIAFLLDSFLSFHFSAEISHLFIHVVHFFYYNF